MPDVLLQTLCKHSVKMTDSFTVAFHCYCDIRWCQCWRTATSLSCRAKSSDRLGAWTWALQLGWWQEFFKEWTLGWCWHWKPWRRSFLVLKLFTALACSAWSLAWAKKQLVSVLGNFAQCSRTWMPTSCWQSSPNSSTLPNEIEPWLGSVSYLPFFFKYPPTPWSSLNENCAKHVPIRSFTTKTSGANIADSEPQPDLMAWSKAVGSRTGCDTLRLALARALSCSSANTSNNERDFADAVAFKCRGPASTFLKAMERRIRVHLTGIAGKELDKLCQDARKIWSDGFGRQRAAGPKFRRALNFSMKGKKRTTDTCQQLWMVLFTVNAAERNIGLSISASMSSTFNHQRNDFSFICQKTLDSFQWHFKSQWLLTSICMSVIELINFRQNLPPLKYILVSDFNSSIRILCQWPPNPQSQWLNELKNTVTFWIHINVIY